MMPDLAGAKLGQTSLKARARKIVAETLHLLQIEMSEARWVSIEESGLPVCWDKLYRTDSMEAIKPNIDFNKKHLKKGDPLPPFNAKLRVYNMRFCPYAQRTILALIAKKIDYEVVKIDLVDKPEWLTSKSAFGKVPALELEEGMTIYESLVTVEYLDEVFPYRPLLPKDAIKKAFDKIIVESIGPIHTIFFKALRQPEDITKDQINAFHNALQFVESQLRSRNTKFLDGSVPGYADYMIWPWFERLLVLDDKILQIDGEKFPLLTKYIENMLQDPVVSSYLVPREVFQKYYEAHKLGKKPNYDLLAN